MKIKQKGIHFTLSGKEAIQSLGLSYAPEDVICRRHMYNNIRIPIDLRHRDDYLLSCIEEDLNKSFAKILVKEMRNSGVRAVRCIEWDRIFLMSWDFNPKCFTAIFYVRFDSVDTDKKTN